MMGRMSIWGGFGVVQSFCFVDMPFFFPATLLLYHPATLLPCYLSTLLASPCQAQSGVVKVVHRDFRLRQ